MDIQSWFEEKFKPWQAAMQQRESERQQYAVIVKNNAAQIKHVVALIHAGRGEEAAAWNALDFPVQFKAMQLSQDDTWLEVAAMNGERSAVPLDELIEVLTELLAG